MRIDRANATILVMLGVLFAAFVALFWIPRHRALSSKRKLVETRARMLADLQAKERDRTAQLSQARPTVPFHVAVPARPELGPLLEEITEDLGAEAVKEPQLRGDTVVTGRDYSRIPLVLQFEGPSTALFNVLERIESRDRIIRVDRLDITGSSLEPGRPLFVDMELSAFFRPREDESS